MIIERCDRCGKEMPLKFPYLNVPEWVKGHGKHCYNIMKHYTEGECIQINLCEDCTKKMDKFMDEINAEKRRMYMEEREEQEKKH